MSPIPTHQLKDKKFHIEKAERNEAFYSKCNMNSFDSGNYNEWAVAVLFYIAVHYVDAVLSQDATLSDNYRDPADHIDRNRAVSKCSKLIPIARQYENLYQRSKDARYDSMFFPDDYVSRIKRTDFNQIRGHARKQLSLPDVPNL